MPTIAGETLWALAQEVEASCLIAIRNPHDEEFLDIDELKELDVHDENKEQVYAVQIKTSEDFHQYTFEKSNSPSFSGIIVEILSDAIKRKFIKQGMKIVVATDKSITKKYQSSILVLDVDRVLYRIGRFKLAEHLASETIIETLIEIGQEIGKEGREGKKVGTLFVIGNADEITPYCRQLIMNPFLGHEKSTLHIVENNNLRETIKNFAQLDGAFIINHEGYIISAGTYIDVDTSAVKPYQGWGTKHLTASAITAQTSAVAILVSESGGTVKVFKNGKLILRLKPFQAA